MPWIIVTSHFPLTHTMLTEHSESSASHYLGLEGEQSEGGAGPDSHFATCPADKPGCWTVAELVKAQAGPLIPIMEKYEVDVYDAGHVHSYEVSWPQRGGNGTASSYAKPQGIVYITEGNGGVPSMDATLTNNTVVDCPFPCRKKGTGGAYGRFSAKDGKALLYEHVESKIVVLSRFACCPSR